jgi:HEAT repeat protein
MKIKFAHALQRILTEDAPFSYTQLQVLSNLEPQDLRAFCRAWPAIPHERRQQVTRALAQLNEDSTDLNFRDVFLVCLDDSDDVVRAAAIEGLGDDESSSLLERLMALVAQEPAADARSQALLALGRFMQLIETTDFLSSYRPRLLRLLLDVFGDPAATLEQRRRALESMAYASGSEEVERAISQAYESNELEMRVSAVHAMGHHLADRWRPAIERELKGPDAEMRYEAAHASGETEDPTLIPHLAPLLGDEDHEVAREAIWALGKIGGARARRLLERCLQLEDEDLQEAAEKGLRVLEFNQDPLRL